MASILVDTARLLRHLHEIWTDKFTEAWLAYDNPNLPNLPITAADSLMEVADALMEIEQTIGDYCEECGWRTVLDGECVHCSPISLADVNAAALAHLSAVCADAPSDISKSGPMTDDITPENVQFHRRHVTCGKCRLPNEIIYEGIERTMKVLCVRCGEVIIFSAIDCQGEPPFPGDKTPEIHHVTICSCDFPDGGKATCPIHGEPVDSVTTTTPDEIAARHAHAPDVAKHLIGLLNKTPDAVRLPVNTDSFGRPATDATLPELVRFWNTIGLQGEQFNHTEAKAALNRIYELGRACIAAGLGSADIKRLSVLAAFGQRVIERASKEPDDRRFLVIDIKELDDLTRAVAALEKK